MLLGWMKRRLGTQHHPDVQGYILFAKPIIAGKLIYTDRSMGEGGKVAGDGRHSPLIYTYIAGAVECFKAGDGRHSPLIYTREIPLVILQIAGDGRHSPLIYTGICRTSTEGCAGDGRHSPLIYTYGAAVSPR